MGCTQTRGGNIIVEEEFREVDTAKMDAHKRFEHSLPLYRMHISDFEGKVKRFVIDKDYVTLK